MTDKTEELTALRDELKDLIREAHGATKDLAKIVRDARNEINKLMHTSISNEMNLLVEARVSMLTEATQQAMRDSVKKVQASFDNLADIYMNGTKGKEGDSLSELGEAARKHRERREASKQSEEHPN